MQLDGAGGDHARQREVPLQAHASKHLTKHPEGFSTLFFAELWERFSYYGMRAILVYYMTAPVAAGGLGYSIADAAMFYGNYTMAVYLLSVPGGFVADRFFGARQCVVVGGIVIALGHFALAWGGAAGFYAGLVLVAIGTGVFKPNINALLGNLYELQDTRRDAGFTLFYMGINTGGFLAPLVTGFLAQSDVFKQWLAQRGYNPLLSWHWGFAAAGVGMTLALVIFMLRGQKFVGIGEPPPQQAANWLQTAAVLVASGLLLALLIASDRMGLQWLRYLLIAIPLAAIAYFSWRPDRDAKRLAAVFVLFVAAMLFWAAFEQAGLSIALFAEHLTDNNMFGWTIPSAWYQSLNPLFVILLAPLIVILWTRLDTRQPSTPVKFALGSGLLALSFVVMAGAAHASGGGAVGPWWLVVYFLLITIGELCLSPVGLSAMTKLAPARLVGLVLGIWFLAAAFGNKLAGVFGAGFTADDPSRLATFFLGFAALGAVVMIAMLVLTPWLQRQMAGEATPVPRRGGEVL